MMADATPLQNKFAELLRWEKQKRLRATFLVLLLLWLWLRRCCCRRCTGFYPFAVCVGWFRSF